MDSENSSVAQPLVHYMCLLSIIFASNHQFSMSNSGSDDVHHEWDDMGSDASTVAFSDDSSTEELYSETSSHGTLADFLEQWTCHVCEVVPALESAERLCQKWIEDQDCLIVDDTAVWKVHIMCRSCNHIAHLDCLVEYGHMALAMLNQVLEEGEYTCVACYEA